MQKTIHFLISLIHGILWRLAIIDPVTLIWSASLQGRSTLPRIRAKNLLSLIARNLEPRKAFCVPGAIALDLFCKIAVRENQLSLACIVMAILWKLLIAHARLVLASPLLVYHLRQAWLFNRLANGWVVAGFAPLACFLNYSIFFEEPKLNDIYSKWHAVPCHLNRKIAIKMQKNYEGNGGLRPGALFFCKISTEKLLHERRLDGMFLA